MGEKIWDFKCHKYYDKKGRRLSIYAQKMGEYLEIVVIPCSKEDKFKKKEADHLFLTVPYTPESIKIENNKPRSTFLKWCKENFYLPMIEFKAVTYTIYEKATLFDTITINK